VRALRGEKTLRWDTSQKRLPNESGGEDAELVEFVRSGGEAVLWKKAEKRNHDLQLDEREYRRDRGKRSVAHRAAR